MDPSKKQGENRRTAGLHVFGLSGRDAMLCVAALTCAVLLGAWGFTNHAFWDDEASTALFARNLLATGELTAWDGVNLIGYRLGVQLDESLQNPYAPPLQYYIAAAGFYLFGETTFGGRILFLIAGILALPALMLWTRRHFDGRVPLWLPALIAATTPAFLLFIRQCRYYAPAMLFTLCLLAAWSWTGSTRRSRLAVLAAGALSTAGLWYASYLNAVVGPGHASRFLSRRPLPHPAEGGFPRCRPCRVADLRHPYLFCKGPDGSPVRADELHHGHRPHRGALCPAHGRPGCLRVLSRAPDGGADGALCRAAFRAPPPVCPPGMGRVSGHDRGDPGTALFSPQPVSGAANADMRYVAPLILVGAAVTAVCLVILWDLSRPLACLAAILVVMTNALTLSWVAVPQIPLRSTLLSYLAEGAQDYKTGTEALVEAVAALPGGSRVLIFPDYMTYGPMFYVPGQRYCWQLTERKTLQPGLRETLPDYLFVERARPDFILTGPVAPESLIARFEGKFGKGTYRLRGYLQGDWRDCSRPEIPLHCFGPPPPRPDQRGIAVIEATGR